MKPIYKLFGKWRSNWSELCTAVFLVGSNLSYSGCVILLVRHTKKASSLLFSWQYFLRSAKKLPRNPRATWSGMVRKTCLQNPSDLKYFCPCLYLWNPRVTLSYSTMSFLPPKSGMAAVCGCLCELHMAWTSGHTSCTSQTLLVELHNFFWFTAPITGCFSPFCSCTDDCSRFSTKLVPADFFLLYFSLQINSTT